MGRQPGLHFNGAIFHAMARGNDGQAIFIDDKDRANFIEAVVLYSRRFGTRILAFCLMPNHFHLMAQVDNVPIWTTMQCLLTSYARHFNIRHRRRGHLFQNRYKKILCDRDNYALELIRYIHLNPVRANIVTDPSEWPWSSHRAYLGHHATPWVDTNTGLGFFHGDGPESRARYAQFIRDFAPDAAMPVVDALILEERVETRSAILENPISLILDIVAKETGVSKNVMRSRIRLTKVVLARRRAIDRALSAGYRTCEIAAALNCTSSYVAKVARGLLTSINQQLEVAPVRPVS
jgi:REP element-mobilizing transposase RayT